MRWIFAIALLCSPAFAAFTDYYVTSNGTDTWANATSSGTPCSIITAFANASPGDRVNVKADATYSISAELTPTNDGTLVDWIWYRGYTTIIGDGGTATLSYATSGYVRILNGNSKDNHIIESIKFTAVTTRETVRTGEHWNLYNCQFINTSTSNNGIPITMYNGTIVDSCYIDNSAPNKESVRLGVASVVCNSIIKTKYIGVLQGFTSNSGGAVINNLIIGDGSSDGIDLAAYGDDVKPMVISGNTIVGFVDCINLATVSDNINETILILNNIIWDCSGYGIYNAEVGTIDSWGMLNGNAIGNTTSGNTNIGDQPEYNAISLGANNPFTDSAGGDYTIDPDSTGGALVAGFAQTSDIDHDGIDDNWRDVGALQREVTAGGTTIIIIED